MSGLGWIKVAQYTAQLRDRLNMIIKLSFPHPPSKKLKEIIWPWLATIRFIRIASINETA